MVGVHVISLAALCTLALSLGSLAEAKPLRVMHQRAATDWKGAHRIQPAAALLGLDVGAKVDIAATVDAGSQSASTVAKVELNVDLHAGFNSTHVNRVAMRISGKSWEYGATYISLLEVKNKELSVFSADAFKDDIPNVDAQEVEALRYIRPRIRLGGDALADGDGSAGDPASLGVGAILLGQRDSKYLKAAKRQAEHLLNRVPRNRNGAISMRENIAQQWADQIFMIPPFLAYYAVATNNVSLLSFVVDDIGRNRDILRLRGTGTKADGLWKHISNSSNGLWSTGNAWVSLGMVRVLATMQNWSTSKDALKADQDRLRAWLHELFGCLEHVQRDDDNGLYPNYLIGGSKGYSDDFEPWGGEVAGTAALAAAAYRFAVLEPNSTKIESYLAEARKSRLAIIKHTNKKTGIVGPNVNPLAWDDRNYVQHSPEAQAFVSMLGAAYIDCRAAGPCTEDNS